MLVLVKWVIRGISHLINQDGWCAKTSEGCSRLNHLVDVEVLGGLSCVLSLLEEVHNLIKFNQLWVVFVWFDYYNENLLQWCL